MMWWPILRSRRWRPYRANRKSGPSRVHRFTVGQRKGLGIPFSEALYVVEIDAATGEVVVGPRSALQTKKFRAEGWNWHAPEGEHAGEAWVQVRYRQDPGPAKLFGHDDGVMIEWIATPQCVTPGQAAVAYAGDTVVGGGWIVGGRT